MHDAILPPRLAWLSLALAAVSPSFLEVNIPFFNAPITVIGMAAAGATMSFAFGLPESSRKRLFGVAIFSTFAGACGVTVLPAAFHLEWVSPLVQAPFAFFLAFLARWIVPLFLKLLPALSNRYLGTTSNPPPSAGGQP